MATPAKLDHSRLAAELAAVGQQHVYTFYDNLGAAQRAALDGQVAALDWQLIDQLVRTVVQQREPFKLTGTVLPAPYYANQPKDHAAAEKYAKAFARGEELLRQGKVAAFVVAGGQGTRLGWEAPKGTYPATAVKNKPLFQCFAEFLRATEKRYGREVPFYIMTSPVNDGATRDFWKQHGYFGLRESAVMFLMQDSLPALGFDGKALLERKDALALSPNGHGGSLLALHKSGALADMAKRGITQISYFQVDNPIVRCVDPLFLGLHDLDGAQMSSKMLPKVGPKERLGNLCLLDGKMTVIEYSDLPDELAQQRVPTGELRFRAGSIALHAMTREFAEGVNRHGFALPYHRAEKKVTCIDPATGKNVKPAQPNAVKLETFVFDALPLAKTSIVYETDREDEFAPIKQAEGVDSVTTSRAITTARNAHWLKLAGVPVPRKADGTPDCIIEMAWSFALYPEDVKRRKAEVPVIVPGAKVYLE